MSHETLSEPSTLSSHDASVRTNGLHERPPVGPAIDDSKLISGYANFIRVTGTAEEVVVDFGLHAQIAGGAADPVLLQQRAVVNFYTAKRLLAALHMTVERYEAAFGVLETDVQKRTQLVRR